MRTEPFGTPSRELPERHGVIFTAAKVADCRFCRIVREHLRFDQASQVAWMKAIAKG